LILHELRESEHEFRDGVPFKSGLAITGLTSLLQSRTPTGSNFEYIDTPGLSDLKMRQRAAEQITLSLKKEDREGDYRLFFIITLESGRIKEDDKTTMKLVLDSIWNHYPCLQYGVVINQLNNPIYKKCLNKMDKYVKTLNNGLPMPLNKIYLYHRFDEAEGEENYKIPLDEKFKDFILSLPPTKIDSCNVSSIQGILMIIIIIIIIICHNVKLNLTKLIIE
jgi:hypothetical protein